MNLLTQHPTQTHPSEIWREQSEWESITRAEVCCVCFLFHFYISMHLPFSLSLSIVSFTALLLLSGVGIAFDNSIVHSLISLSSRFGLILQFRFIFEVFLSY